MKQANEGRELDTPPYFKSWKTIYLLVIGNLVALVALMYLFTLAY
ncbi:hypothetical protein C7460_11356 [Marinoscillum furvescens DSM 4134]|uniref:Uncharacterized protein n=1 Tax=Marinoscillum furvescens DSM 4134 TaxID=1122208 RepID=A0A3D9L3R9_MARFU|nr:hypothetical protein C7460_11356 [Marinoscillum furvescens DSM 4134]